MKLILILFSLVMNQAVADINLNPDEVRPWSKKEKIQFPTPLAAVFKKEDRVFIFVGDHHSDPATTYKYIHLAFQKYSPEIVVVEGLDFAEGENPKKWKDKYSSKTKEEVWKDPSLGAGTELIAIERKIPFIGGEPSIEEKMSSPFLLDKAFDADDIRNVQILQRIPYRRDQLKISDLDSFLDYALTLYKVKELKSIFKTKFLAWYKKRTQKEFNYSKITKVDAEVNCKPNDTFLQKVACATNIERDRALVQHLGMLLKTHQRVLVVYGTGHFVQEYPAFLKAFSGPPEYLKESQK